MLFRQDPPYPSSLANPVLFSSSTITTKYYSSSREGLIRKKKRNHPIFSFLMMTVRKLMKFKTKKEQMKCALTIDRLPSSSLSHARVHFF